MIAHLDAGIGSILSTAAELGLLENTVVVYTADHGLALGQNGLMGKQNLYEHSLHVPLMMAGPGVRRGPFALPRVARRHARHRAGHGRDRDRTGIGGAEPSPLLQGSGSPPRSTFCAAYRTSQRMIRDGRYKLIRYYPWSLFPVPATEGYPIPRPAFAGTAVHLQEDPGELVNLVWREDLQPVRRDLAAKLEDGSAAAATPILSS